MHTPHAHRAARHAHAKGRADTALVANISAGWLFNLNERYWELTLYQFGTLTAKHYFCRHCGVSPFTRPRLDPARWAVNLRCIDALDLSSLEIQEFDGVNWEEAAKAIDAKPK